jgi:ubiquinone/menaquinone biosynthesis C-methylase UbiE/predicted transcriptional regulator
MIPAPDIFTEYAGWMKIRIILTAAELDFFTLLHRRPLTAEELAKQGALDTHATSRLLACLVTFGLLHKEGEIYGLSEQGAYFSLDHPESVLPMVLHMNDMWDNWTKLTETVKEGANPDLKPVIGARNEAVTRAFIGAMHVVGRSLSREIAAAYDSTSFRRLLDIGGGSGTYTIAFLERNPSLTGVIFDLPGVLPHAEERLKEAGYSDRVALVAGDFHQDELPQGSDLALLSAIIHSNSQKQNNDLFKRIFRSLVPGGAVLIRDHIMDQPRTWPPAGTLFAINMLVHTMGGDTYTFPEVKEGLEQAGFQMVRQVRTGERMDALVEGRKPV